MAKETKTFAIHLDMELYSVFLKPLNPNIMRQEDQDQDRAVVRGHPCDGQTPLTVESLSKFS